MTTSNPVLELNALIAEDQRRTVDQAKEETEQRLRGGSGAAVALGVAVVAVGAAIYAGSKR